MAKHFPGHGVTTAARLFHDDMDPILLYIRYNVIQVIDRVEPLMAARRITPWSIDRDVRRVLCLKSDYGLLIPRLQ